MAVTKTHPIKSTLKAAIDYILNPEKTDGKLLASSFGCGLETADIEFAWTREAAGDRGTHLGRHLIQSFAVGETTPEEAHKIGMELAGAVLGGKYEFVLTTHVDKDHLHNHLIFNAVSFVDYKKYHSNKQSYHFIRRTSDRICKEHGLSVVVPGQDKGKSYAEYTAEKQGTSYKAKLKTAIDTLIPQVKDFDELLRRLQEMGYADGFQHKVNNLVQTVFVNFAVLNEMVVFDIVLDNLPVNLYCAIAFRFRSFPFRRRSRFAMRKGQGV